MASGEGQALQQCLEDSKSKSHKEPTKAGPVKLNRSSHIRDDTVSSSMHGDHDHHRKRKFNGEKEGHKSRHRDHVSHTKKDESRSHQDGNLLGEPLSKNLENGVSVTEKLLQENVVTSAPENHLNKVQERLEQPCDCKEEILDENSNTITGVCNGEDRNYMKENQEGLYSECPKMRRENKESTINEQCPVLEQKQEEPQGERVSEMLVSDKRDQSLEVSANEERNAISEIAESENAAEPSEDDPGNVVEEKGKEQSYKAEEEKTQDVQQIKEKEDVEKSERKKGKESEKKGNSEKREKEKKEDDGGSIKERNDVKSKETVKKGKENKSEQKKAAEQESATVGMEGANEKRTEEKRTTTEGKHNKSEKKLDKKEKRDPLKSKDKGHNGDRTKAKDHSHKVKTKDKDGIKENIKDSKLLMKHSGSDLNGLIMEGTQEAVSRLHHSVKVERSEKPIDNAKKKTYDVATINEKVHLREKSFDEELDEIAKLKKLEHKAKKKERELKNQEEKRKGHLNDKKESKSSKREMEDKVKSESEVARKKPKKESESIDGKEKPKVKSESKDDGDEMVTNETESKSRKRKSGSRSGGTRAKKTKEEVKKEEESKWKWWEEENYEDGVKWKFLEHKGPYFAPPYEPLPDDVQFYYDGKPMKLSLEAEEVATFYGKMLDHEYTTKEAFQKNFFTDWKTQMTSEERKIIKHLHKCDFSEIHKYYFDKNEARKALPKEEKQKLKEEANKIQEEYGYCMLDGHREKIGNFKTEPPGLFRGRGDHPKMGMLKMRIMPEDVIINCSKESKIPEPPPGHKWKEVRCDNTVTWLVSWTENIQNSIKYIMLNPSSKLKGEKDWQKYEIARRLKNVVGQIRSQYREDWKSREMKKRQRAVALYFIDKLALRAGNEKEEGETADTVGCCSLRVEHIELHSQMDGQKYVVEFDFLGKDSIRYYNKVPVEKEVFKNLKRFMENKNPEDDLFDRLNTTIVNKHLQDLMEGLTAKVFRTYNASITLQNQLKELTNADDNVAAKILSYNRANRAVALLCNHQRALPKTFEKSMQNLQAKIDAKEQQVKEAKKELKKAKADHKARETDKTRRELEKKKKQLERLEDQLMKLKLQATDKEENKQIALGTSKLNYLDPRITVAWCKKYGVPIEKIYNKTQRDKFAWAIDMTDENFEF